MKRLPHASWLIDLAIMALAAILMGLIIITKD